MISDRPRRSCQWPDPKIPGRGPCGRFGAAREAAIVTSDIRPTRAETAYVLARGGEGKVHPGAAP